MDPSDASSPQIWRSRALHVTWITQEYVQVT